MFPILFPSYSTLDVPDTAPSLESVFFDLEIEMEDGICRDEICSDEGKELGKYFTPSSVCYL